MKKYLLIAMFFFFCCVSRAWNELPAGKFSGKADYERFFDETFSIVPEAAVEIAHRMGDLTVTAWERKDVSVKAHIEVEGDDAEEFGKQIRIEIDEEGDPFTIKTIFPDGVWKEISYGVRLEITIPAEHPLEAKNTFGKIDATGMRSGITADAQC